MFLRQARVNVGNISFVGQRKCCLLYKLNLTKLFNYLWNLFLCFYKALRFAPKAHKIFNPRPQLSCPPSESLKSSFAHRVLRAHHAPTEKEKHWLLWSTLVYYSWTWNNTMLGWQNPYLYNSEKFVLPNEQNIVLIWDIEESVMWNYCTKNSKWFVELDFVFF